MSEQGMFGAKGTGDTSGYGGLAAQLLLQAHPSVLTVVILMKLPMI